MCTVNQLPVLVAVRVVSCFSTTQLRAIAPFEVSLIRQSGLLSVGLIQEEASQGATGRMRPV